MSVTIDGAARFSATLQAAAADLRDLSDAHEDAVEALEAKGRARAPRRTGELVGSFGTRVTAAGAELVVGARHAPFVQFGTRNMSARPFMPDDPARDVTPLYLDHVDDIVGQIKGK